MFWKVFSREPKGDDVKDLFPGKCECCQRSWKWEEGHATKFSDTNGIFPLCETCWEKLTPEGRLPYYWDLFRGKWEMKEEEFFPIWLLIKTAVLGGMKLKGIRWFIKIQFEPRDFWIGFYFKKSLGFNLYFCPLPMIAIHIYQGVRFNETSS